MSNTKSTDISGIRFTSTAFPTPEDMRLWHSLSAEQQRAIIMADVKEGLEGPPAPRSTKDELMADVLAEYAHAL